MVNNINDLILNSINSNKLNNIKYENELINNFYRSIKINKKLFDTTNKIDLSNKNGFEIDYNVIDNIFKKYTNKKSLLNENEEILLTNDNLLCSKLYSKLGIIHVIYDGNTYTLIEMIILGLLTHNTIIFSDNDYMLGTNGLIITMIQSVLEKENYIKEMFQIANKININDIFENFKTINKTIIIGDNILQNKYLKLTTTETLVSGYNNFDIYIEDLSNIETIKNIIKQRININIYVNSNLSIDLENVTYVTDIDEAITQINYNSALFASSIFTKDKENASKFLKNIKSKNIFVNTSPTINYNIDITEENLLKNKNVFMPNIF